MFAGLLYKTATVASPYQYLGSEPVQHYADYEGCLQIMNKLFTVHQLNSRRRRKRRSSVEGGGLVLTFTPQRLFIVNKDTQVNSLLSVSVMQ